MTEIENIYRKNSLNSALRVVLVLNLVLLNIYSTKGQNTNKIKAKDTLRFETKNVLIESKKIVESNSKYQNTTIITQKEIKSIHAIQMTDVLKTAPGVYISDYGGVGGVKTVSMRGLASNNTLVLVDGVRLNSLQNGSFDFSSFIINNINEVEVNKSGNSSFYGGNSTAGVVNLKTNSNFSENDKITNKIELSYGNLKDYVFQYQTSNQLFGQNINVNVGHIYNSGAYNFNAIQFGERVNLNRINSDFSNFNTHLNINNNENKNAPNELLYNVNMFINSNDRGVPGPVLQNVIENSNARLTDNDLTVISNINYKIENNVETEINDDNKNNKIENDKIENEKIEHIVIKDLEIKSLVKYNNLNYKDPNALYYSNNGLDNSFFAQDYLLRLDYNENRIDSKLKLSGELAYNKLYGDMLDKSINYASRGVISLSSYIDKRIWKLEIDNIAENKEKSDELTKKSQTINAIASIRYDYFNDFGSMLSPFVGVRYDNQEYKTNVKLNYSYNFRPPSFNEMYYLNFGNKNLLPEKSSSISFDLNTNIIENIDFNLNLSNIQTKNRIISIPKSPVVWTAYNLGNVEVNSVELSIKYDLNQNFTFNFGYLYQIALDKTQNSVNYDKQLPYTPNEIINFNLFYSSNKFEINLLNRYNSFRYTTANNNTNEYLSNFIITDLNFNYNFVNENENKSNFYTAFVSLNNIFNREFSLINNFPMPGRLIRTGVKFGF